VTLSFHEIDEIDAIVEDHPWEFARQHADEIDAFWQAASAGKSGMFNGTVLVQSYGAVDGRVFHARYRRTEYKSFLGFLRLPHECPGYRNGFAMAALRSADGAFLLGEMGAGTANAGKIYFAAGTPDESDIVDGKVDLAQSVIRELAEETGLFVTDVRISLDWTAVMVPKKVAFMRRVEVDMPAEDARRMMLERMRSLHEEELSNIVILRPGDRLLDDPRLPDFVSAYIRREFELEGRR
jgi:8-oxo-dGTP pyrophosphatase MutT (NUDIX family)